MNNGKISDKIAVIMGHSRSGTSWLGSIVNSHPDLIYRYEPFSNLRHFRSDIIKLRQDFQEGRVDDKRLRQLYDILIKADPICVKPPFFPKGCRTRLRYGQKMLWPISRAVRRPTAVLYSWLYTPLDEPKLVFKDVNKERLMAALSGVAGVRSVYIIRHPCAVVSSHLLGQQRGLMHPHRENYLDQKMADHDPALFDRYGGKTEQLSKAQRRALLWRIGVEQAVRAAKQHSPSIRLVAYERMCLDPAGVITGIFQHVGLSIAPATLEFLQICSQDQVSSRARYGAISANNYFSVFRDPRVSMNRWREKMPEETCREVCAIVADSPAYAYGLSHGGWDEQA